jgi:hypothetical protein
MPFLVKYFCQSYGIEEENFKKLFFSLLILSFLYFLPFIVDSMPYFDDYFHRSLGSSNSAVMGRPLSTYILSILNFEFNFNFLDNSNLINTAPFNLIVAIIVFSASIATFCLKVFENKVDFLNTLASFSIIACPYYLQVATYNFECIVPTSSFCLALLASINTENKTKNIIWGTLLLFIALGIYQVGFNFFLGASFILFLVEYSKNSELAIEHLIVNGLKLLIASISYQYFLLNICSLCDFAVERTELLAFNGSLFSNTISNLKIMLHYPLSAFSSSYLLLAFMLISVLCYSYQYAIKNEKPISAAIVFVVTLVGILISCFGVLVLLKIPFIEPRAFCGFAMLLFFCFYCFNNSIATWLPKINILPLLMIVFLFFISFAYYNIHKSQTNFNKMVGFSLRDKLESLGINKDTKITVEGSLGYSKKAYVATGHNKLLEMISRPQDMSGSWYTKGFFLNLDSEIDFDDNKFSEEELEELCEAEALFKNSFYRINQVNESFMVSFRYGDCY